MKKPLMLTLTALALAATLLGCNNTTAPDYANGYAIPQSKCAAVADGLAGNYQCRDVSFAEFDSYFNAKLARDQGNAGTLMTFSGVIIYNRVAVRGDVEATSSRYRLATIYTPTACQNNPALLCPFVTTYAVVDTYK